MYCPKCNKENPDNARFCNSCGTALTQSGALSKIEKFSEENSRKMAQLYGKEFADSSRWGPDLAARLILAYLDRKKRDKLWYKQVAKIKKAASESEEKLIVCCCYTGIVAHTGRALVVAQQLRTLGHEVIFAVDTDKKYVELIKNSGFKIYHLPQSVDVATINYWQQLKGTMGFYNARMLQEESENMFNILKEIKGNNKEKEPDIIVTDFAWGVAIPADIMDIPVASIWNFLFTNYNKTKLSSPEAHPITKLVYKLGGDRGLELFKKSNMVKLILGLYLIWWVLPYNWVRIKYMLKERRFIEIFTKIRRNIFSQICGQINLCPDYAAFGGMKVNHKNLPVGPILWEPKASDQDGQLVDEFEEFLEDQEKPLIYVTMGSSGMLKLFKLIIAALEGKDYRVAITTGNQFEISELGKLPENFFVLPFYPGTEICKRASLMINHGGSGSINQAIQNRLPQICIPANADQQWISDLVENRKLGRQILPGKLTVEGLAAAVEELLPKK